MAKKRDDFDDAPFPAPALLGPGPGPSAPDPDPEKVALTARVAELEALLAAQGEAPLLVTAGDQTGYWEVSLEHAPTHVVRAVDPANAWNVYKSEMGVIGSASTPNVRPASREAWHAAQARRFGKRPEEFVAPGE